MLAPAILADRPSILEPAGPAARLVEGLWWPMLWISTVVFVVVVVGVVASVVRARAAPRDPVDTRPVRWGEPFVVVAGVVVPALILAGTYVFSLTKMNDMVALGAEAKTELEVIAHNWWWEVRYPNGAVSANEIHIPVGEPVLLKLSTVDVIHSFWVPRLQVKIDHLPGQVNELWIQADEPGVYRGQCAEFCGVQHANMAFDVIARDDFDTWVEREFRPVAVGRPGEEVFMNSTCVGCHAIRGTDAIATVGPDLTHFGSRRTIAAGTVENTRGNLAHFIRDPQDVKPGVGMPPTELTEEELDALLDYLIGLK